MHSPKSGSYCSPETIAILGPTAPHTADAMVGYILLLTTETRRAQRRDVFSLAGSDGQGKEPPPSANALWYISNPRHTATRLLDRARRAAIFCPIAVSSPRRRLSEPEADRAKRKFRSVLSVPPWWKTMVSLSVPSGDKCISVSEFRIAN
jgi:hypothetical protein